MYMQGSKIVPDKTYAYRKADGNLVRFVATAVITKRTGRTGSPHDYSSSVEGFILEDNDPEGRHSNREIITLLPKHLLGPYEESVELVARENAEKAERQRQIDEREAARKAVVDWLYQWTHVEQPEPGSGFYRNHHFARSHSGVEINDAGVKAILMTLKAMKGADNA